MRWGEQPTEPEPPVEPVDPPPTQPPPAGEKPPKPKPPTEPPPTEPPPDDDLVLIAAGTYSGFPKTIKNGKHYKADGAVTIRKPNGQDDTLRIVEKHEITFEGFLFTGAARAGVFVADSDDICFIDCESSDNRVQGFLTIDSRRLVFERCEAHRNEQQHGFYLSGSTRGAELLNCEASRNGRAGLQVNSEGAGHGAEGLVVQDLAAYDNQQSDNGAEVNLMGAGTSASPLRMDDSALRPESGKRAMYCGDYAAGRECYGRIDRLDANGHVENESPKTLDIHRI